MPRPYTGTRPLLYVRIWVFARAQELVFVVELFPTPSFCFALSSFNFSQRLWTFSKASEEVEKHPELPELPSVRDELYDPPPPNIRNNPLYQRRERGVYYCYLLLFMYHYFHHYYC
jgi:hypothetical protein